MIGLVEQKDFDELMKRVEELERQNKAKDGEIAALKHRVAALEPSKWQRPEKWPNVGPAPTPWYSPSYPPPVVQPGPGWPTCPPVWCTDSTGKPPVIGYTTSGVMNCKSESDALK